MLQIWLRTLLATELVIYLALGWWMYARGFAALQIAFTILLIAIVWRLSHATGSFVVARILRRREGGSEPPGTAWKAWVGECSARFVSFNWSQPFAEYVMGADPVVAGHGQPVILVHGYFSSRGMWCRFRDRLEAARIGPVFTINLEPPFASIDVFAGQLANRIEQVCAETGAAQVFVIAHSMGGLVTRAYMQQHGRQRVAGFVSLGSPHHGSKLANFGLGKCVRQIQPQSQWLTTLDHGEARLGSSSTVPLPAWSIYSTNDDLAYPPESSRLGWADNIAVDGVGHVGLLFAPEVFTIVETILNNRRAHRPP